MFGGAKITTIMLVTNCLEREAEASQKVLFTCF